MLRTVIIDDEKDARINTINLVNTYCSNITIVGIAQNVAEGVDKIKEVKPDLILLDIDMPDGSGFDLLKKLMPINFYVIFITAYAEHAIKAIKFNALDYLLKPLDIEDLLLAVNKATVNKNSNHETLKINNLLEEIHRPEKLRIALSTCESIYFISPEQIIRVEADANYSHFYLTDNRKIMVSKPLKEYAELLECQGFFRTHQSHLINLAYLKQYDKAQGGYIVLNNNEQIPMIARKKENLLKAFKEFKK